MLYSLLTRGGDIKQIFIIFLLTAPIVLISLSVHELSHGYAAYKMGDMTARNLGRLSLNPIRHLDPIGTLMMVLFGFGWAKPVPINTRNFRNPKAGMAVSALAGPVSNLLLAFIGYMLYRVAMVSLPVVTTGFAYNIEYILINFLVLFYYLNIRLAVFNLIPVPPLDGSRILLVFLPTKAYFAVMKYERIISLVIMLALFTGLLSVPLMWISNGIENGFAAFANLFPFLR